MLAKFLLVYFHGVAQGASLQRLAEIQILWIATFIILNMLWL